MVGVRCFDQLLLCYGGQSWLFSFQESLSYWIVEIICHVYGAGCCSLLVGFKTHPTRSIPHPGPQYEGSCHVWCAAGPWDPPPPYVYQILQYQWAAPLIVERLFYKSPLGFLCEVSAQDSLWRCWYQSFSAVSTTAGKCTPNLIVSLSNVSDALQSNSERSCLITCDSYITSLR